jgi:GTP-binding protein
MSLFGSARFFTTVVNLAALPRSGHREVAFVGRSNAGKSSAINALCNRRQLARTSSSPGRTQALNYFTLGPEDRPIGYLVDTPGYGFAAAPLAVKHQWDGLAGRYLQVREALHMAVLVVDIRRQITNLDATLIRWVPNQVQLLVIATKADKLTRQAQKLAVLDIERQLKQLRRGAPTETVLFSADKRIGVEVVQAKVLAVFQNQQQVLAESVAADAVPHMDKQPG